MDVLGCYNALVKAGMKVRASSINPDTGTIHLKHSSSYGGTSLLIDMRDKPYPAIYLSQPGLTAAIGICDPAYITEIAQHVNRTLEDLFD